MVDLEMVKNYKMSFAVVLMLSGTAVMGHSEEVSPKVAATKPAGLESAARPSPPPVLPASVTVKRDHTVVKLKPTNRIRRRGVVMKGARLPVHDKQSGAGCRQGWYRVLEDGWICGDDVVPSSSPPSADRYPVVPTGELTPWSYGFVREPTLEYKSQGGQLVEVRELQKGFGFGIAGRFRAFGVKYFRTAEKTLIPRTSAGMTGRISTFGGVALTDGKPWPVGFVNSRRAFAYSEPTLRKDKRLERADRYTLFEVLETKGKGPRFVRFDEGAWFKGRDVRIVRPAPLPKGVKPGERWIDVDTRRQMMTAYEGETPVYATLISSGRFSSGTVKGEYRIWAKVAAIAMDNTDEELEAPEIPAEETPAGEESPDAGGLPETERHLYSLHDVPWTQFFHESYALHGVYWHDAFGNRKSHGCVNLSPKDAKWFYGWTSPHVPPGWWAIHASEKDPGTLVRVR